MFIVATTTALTSSKCASGFPGERVIWLLLIGRAVPRPAILDAADDAGALDGEERVGTGHAASWGWEAISSWRRSARSNLPFGDRGKTPRTSTSAGTMYAGSTCRRRAVSAAGAEPAGCRRGGVEAGGIARCHDEDDPMAECLVVEAECDGILGQAGLVRHLL